MRATLFLSAVLILPVLALPPDAEALKAKRDAKITEINTLYARELDKLQKRAMADGNLAGANDIAKEITTVTPDLFLTGNDKIQRILSNSSWKLAGSEKTMIFRTDGVMVKSWGKLTPPWTVENGTVFVEDSKATVAPDLKSMTVVGGDKSGKWIKTN